MEPLPGNQTARALGEHESERLSRARTFNESNAVLPGLVTIQDHLVQVDSKDQPKSDGKRRESDIVKRVFTQDRNAPWKPRKRKRDSLVKRGRRLSGLIYSYAEEQVKSNKISKLTLEGVSKFKSLLAGRNKKSLSNRRTDSKCTRSTFLGMEFYVFAAGSPHWCIHPESTLYIRWWQVSMFLVVYVAFMTPFSLAFKTSNRYGPLEGIDNGMDFLFCVDLLVNFRIGYYEHGTLQTNPWVISGNYLKMKFWVDLIGSIPSQAYQLVGLDGDVLGLFRLVRLNRLYQFFKGLESDFRFSYYTVISFKFLTLVFMIGHWAACFFFLLAKKEHFTDDTWVGVMHPSLEHDAVSTQYIASLYWAFTTLTTVGYGDVSPVNNEEKLFTVFVMLVNMGISAYIVGNVTLIATKQDAETAEHRSQLTFLTEFLLRKKIPDGITHSALSHLQLSYDMRDENDEALKLLPPFIRVQILQHLYRKNLHSCYVFKGCGASFIDQVTSTVSMDFLFPDAIMVSMESQPDSLYIVVEGNLECQLENDTTFFTLGPGDTFAEEAVICDIFQPWTVRTKTFCKLLVMNRVDFYKVAERSPNELQRCQRNIYERAKLKEVLVLDQDARIDPIRRDVCRAIEDGYLKKRQELITRICYLCSSGDLNALRSALSDNTLDVNCADYDGRCGLHLAAHNGHTAVMTFLLSKGADPNVQDSFGNTPLWEAVKWNQHDACLILRQAKAQLLLPDPAGVLCSAAHAADGALIRSLLQNGIDPNCADHDHRTCLHLAAAEGILRTVKDMVMYGAHVNCVDRWGHTPLSEARLNAHSAIVDFLIENGAK